MRRETSPSGPKPTKPAAELGKPSGTRFTGVACPKGILAYTVAPQAQSAGHRWRHFSLLQAIIIMSTMKLPRDRISLTRPLCGRAAPGVARSLTRQRYALLLVVPLLLLQTFEAANLFCNATAHNSLLSFNCPHHPDRRGAHHEEPPAEGQSEDVEGCRCPSSRHSLPDGLIRLALDGVGVPLDLIDFSPHPAFAHSPTGQLEVPSAGPPLSPPKQPPRLLS